MGLMKRFAPGGGMHDLARGFGVNKRGRRTFLEVEWFFDQPRVMSAVDDATRRELSKFGAFVRSTARQSIRAPRRKPVADLTESERRKYEKTGERPFASSKPGEPPRNQTGLLKDNIFFFYNPGERSVAIFPAKMRTDDIPGTLEHGGFTRLKDGRVVRIEARPYMGPALEKEQNELEGLWRNSVR